MVCALTQAAPVKAAASAKRLIQRRARRRVEGQKSRFMVSVLCGNLRLESSPGRLVETTKAVAGAGLWRRMGALSLQRAATCGTGAPIRVKAAGSLFFREA